MEREQDSGGVPDQILHLDLGELRLRKMLATDLSTYFPEPLKLVKEEMSLGGAGRLDILAKAQGGEMVVIELKVVRATREAIGQLASYMGAVEEKQKRLFGPIRGYLVAPAFDEGCIQASKVFGQISLLKLNVELIPTLEDVTPKKAGAVKSVQTVRKTKNIENGESWKLDVNSFVLFSPNHVVPNHVVDRSAIGRKAISTSWGNVDFAKVKLMGTEQEIDAFLSTFKLKADLFHSNASGTKQIRSSTSAWPMPRTR